MESAVTKSEIYEKVIPQWREPSWLSRKLRKWFPKLWNPRLGVVVYEYAEGDWECGDYIGDPVRAWRVSQAGTVEIPPSTEVERSSLCDGHYEYSIIEFCISTDLSRIMISSIGGPLCGSGMVYDIAVCDGLVNFENPRRMWIS